MTTNTATVIQFTPPKEWVSCADTAKELRKALKAAFPSITFSVKSKTYSGGASITVSWTDGPTTEMVDRVAGAFAGCTFDGSVDLKEYHASEYQGRRVQWGANFVFTRREHSAELIDKACAYVEAKYGIANIDRTKYYNDNRNVCSGEQWEYHWQVSTQVNIALAHMLPNGCMVTLKVGV